MTKRLAPIATIAALFCVVCLMENSAVRARPAEPRVRNESSIYMLAGEFRTVFANLLWIKAEQYHHEYTARDPNWTRNKDLMGLLDMITALDPHFVEAYGIGVYMLADGYGDPHRALNYLRRAIVANPKAWELHNLAAILYVRRFHDPEHALPHALMAYRFCDDEFYQKREMRLVRTIKGLIQEQKRKR